MNTNKLIIIGASGHGKVVADIARNNDYQEVYFLDDNEEIKECGQYTVIGKTNDYNKYADFDFIVGIGDAGKRKSIQEELQKKGCTVVSLIHPSAVIAEDVIIGSGTVVMAGAIINSGTNIGAGCIVNTAASIDHDNLIGDYVHVSVGSHTAGGVTIGKNTWLGIGAVVSNGIEICADCMIGAGAVVIKKIEETGVYVGVPASKVNV